MDTQVIEIMGRHRLISDLLVAELEVAIPIRDRGIDVIAYIDLHDRVNRFAGCPIQMKAMLDTGFSLDRKYAKFPNLIIAYLWQLRDPKHTVVFAMSYAEALSIADSMGYTKTASWQAGAYVNTRPGKRLTEQIESHRMTSERWWKIVAGASAIYSPTAESPPSLICS